MNSALDPLLFKEITDQSLMGFILFEASSGRAVYSNFMAKQILELSDTRQISVTELAPEQSKKGSTGVVKFKSFSSDLLNHEGLFQNLILKKTSGGSLIASCGIRKLDIAGVKYTLIMVQDTTLQAKLHREIENKQNQIKLAYEELLLQNRQLKDLDIAKNRFIALITHELRTPTSAVVATTDTLRNGLYDSDEDLNAFINMIHEEGHHLLALINDILDFAKIQAGKMDYYIEQKEINSVTSKVVDTLQPLAQKSGIQLSFRANDVIGTCYFDSLRMNQILTNLISNGIKYNRDKGSVTVWLENVDKNVRIHIEDTGKGISPENQDRIFNEFETLGKISAHTKGTGLGLPISKKMIESMGGTIGLKSTEDVGSDFWIDIPTEKVLGESEHYRSRADDSLDDLAA